MLLRYKLIYLFIFIAILFLVYKLINPTVIKNPNNFSTKIISSSATPTPTNIQISNSNSKCHIRGVLPDPNCTPGEIDPSVTQENIYQTICLKGYTKTVRPSATYTNKLKIQQIADYGYTDSNLKDYEEDHLISLELGGSPADPKNLWPEPGASPNLKDKIENICHQKICDGLISLSQAQKEIATNWQTACQ
jgi:hypothetical protein